MAFGDGVVDCESVVLAGFDVVDGLVEDGTLVFVFDLEETAGVSWWRCYARET